MLELAAAGMCRGSSSGKPPSCRSRSRAAGCTGQPWRGMTPSRQPGSQASRAAQRGICSSRSLPTTSSLEQFDLHVYPGECRVTRAGLDIRLSPKEYRLLELFMQHPKRVWSREQLIEQVWGVDYIGDSKTVDVHIRWLREKIEDDPSRPEKLVTVRGFGYRFG